MSLRDLFEHESFQGARLSSKFYEDIADRTGNVDHGFVEAPEMTEEQFRIAKALLEWQPNDPPVNAPDGWWKPKKENGREL